eukprot:TRINITY_DN17184_c0_g1_i1.p1 TRINITY_DN17184_c0_g1~~TRINITY_DN17184_c0_g1_i1.p1  ORF type:complete len:388 (-),score=88.60 TRINITY_DN17184_c0_g1_i1:372-1463(-)
MTTSGDILHLAPCITCHAWSADRTQLAICPNNSSVLMFKKVGTEWKPDGKLKEHDAVITAMDWAPRTNRLVTCSQDRNAYVWTFENGEWKPVLVILRINRAATDVKWSPNEEKFAVASGAKVVSVCHFEAENDWWVSKHIKKHRSTVTRIAWHPNSQLIASGSTDFKARIFSALIKGVDKRPAPCSWWSDKPPVFGECIYESESAGWVHGIAFSPSGNRLAFTGHDSAITFCEAGKPAATLKLQRLPQLDVLFVDENRCVTGGHDCMPLLFTCTGANWAFTKGLDEKVSAPAAASNASSVSNKFKMFQDQVNKGTTDSNATTTVLSTKHQNAITRLNPFTGTGGNLTQFSTSGLDGQVIIWKV